MLLNNSVYRAARLVLRRPEPVNSHLNPCVPRHTVPSYSLNCAASRDKSADIEKRTTVDCRLYRYYNGLQRNDNCFCKRNLPQISVGLVGISSQKSTAVVSSSMRAVDRSHRDIKSDSETRQTCRPLAVLFSARYGSKPACGVFFCLVFPLALNCLQQSSERGDPEAAMSTDPLDAVGQGHAWYGYNLVRALGGVGVYS